MKQLLLVISTLTFLVSACDRGYSYTEYRTFKSEGKAHPAAVEKIWARSDSEALILALAHFDASEITSTSLELPYTPKFFSLENPEGLELSNPKVFANRQYAKKVARNKEKLKEDTYKHDSVPFWLRPKAADLKKFFRQLKQNSGDVWVLTYKPKSAPETKVADAVYCYFMQDQYTVYEPRLTMRCLTNQSIYLKSVILSIDGEEYEYTPEKTQREYMPDSEGLVVESFDEPFNPEISEIVKALSGAKTVLIRYNGDIGHVTRTLTELQLKDIKRTLDYREAIKWHD